MLASDAGAKRRRAARRMAGLGLVVVLFFPVYHAAAVCSIYASEGRQARDAGTGVLIGAEPRDLGPADASCAVLFVHGFVGAGNNFNELPGLAADAGWRVRVMQLPGHGTHAGDLKRISADDLAKAVVEELRRLKADHECVVLVGHSMGGALATMAVAQEGADGLILGAPYFGITHKWYYGLRPETWIKIGSPVVRWVYKGKLFLQVNDRSVKDQIVSYTWIPTKASVTLNEVGRRVNEPGVLELVACPVLAFHSEGDVAASCEATRTALVRMGSVDKTFVDLPRSNHHVFWDFDHEVVYRDSLAFLAKVKMKKTGLP